MSDKKQSTGHLPLPILNQVIEHAVGGFIIFYFNSKTGLPEHAMTFDSPAHCLALQKYISDWTIALAEINIESATNNLKNHLGSETGEEE